MGDEMYMSSKTRRNAINRRNVSQAKYDAIEREERKRRERNNSRYLSHLTALWEARHCASV